MKRKAKILRKTKETNITVAVNLDGKGKYNQVLYNKTLLKMKALIDQSY